MRQIVLKPISKERRTQLAHERILIGQLLIRCGGKCEKCKRKPDWRGLSKHEIIKRSQGGNPLDPNNCLMLCGGCHNREHGIRETNNGNTGSIVIDG